MTQKFLKYLSQTCLYGGLIFGGAQTAFAQSNQTITSGEATIEQIGATNLALIETSDNNFTTVEQNGAGNTANINITGTQNGTVVDNNALIQSGDNNTANITIIGDENLYNISQTSDGAENEVQLNQEGGFNEVSITQDASGFTEGLANIAEVTQIGNNNYAVIDQTALASNVTAFNNQALITQTGDDNLATSTQLGVNNISEQEQVGNDNVSQILQTGNDNLAIHRQFGDNLSLPSDFGNLTIEQTGGANIIVEQYSAVSVLILVACASSTDINNTPQAELSSKQNKTRSVSELNKVSTTQVNQIGQQSSALDAPQISSSVEAEQLTVDQLKDYADRCSPNAKERPPKDLDCSELKLRVKRLYKTDNEIVEALITLDRLGRTDTIDSGLEDLKDGRPGSSFSSQAIAGSVTLPQTPEPTENPDNLEDFLSENGIPVNAGAIIPNRG